MSGIVGKYILAFMMVLFVDLFAKKDSNNDESEKHMVLGVIASNNGRQGIALIKHRDSGRVKAYKVGKYLNKKTRLHSVKRKEVEFKIVGTIVKVSVGGFIPTNAPKFVNERYEDKIAAHGGLERTKNTVKIRSSLKTYLVEKKLGSILMQAGTVPFIENGTFKGFRLLDIDPGSIYETLGFQNGDIVTHINGHSLNDAAVAISALKELKKANNGVITFIRGGQPQELNLLVN